MVFGNPLEDVASMCFLGGIKPTNPASQRTLTRNKRTNQGRNSKQQNDDYVKVAVISGRQVCHGIVRMFFKSRFITPRKRDGKYFGRLYPFRVQVSSDVLAGLIEARC